MAEPAPGRLRPPPRRVPAGLACAMLADRAVMWGSVFVAAGSVVLTVFLLSGDPSGDRRLDASRREAPGRLERVLPAIWERVYSYEYAFRLPDGRSVRGVSYAEGAPFSRERPEVTVEYHPERPELSRLRGARTTPYSRAAFVVGLVAALLLVGLGLLLGLLTPRRNLSRLRLLRDGQLAQATITACRFKGGWFGRSLPIAEFRERWPEEWARASSQGCLGCLFWPFIGLNMLGTVALLIALALTTFTDWPYGPGGRPAPKDEVTRLLAVAMAVWVGGGLVLVGLSRLVGLVFGEISRLFVRGQARPFRRASRSILSLPHGEFPHGDRPPDVMPGRQDGLEVRCAFEFRGPGNELIQASDVALFTRALGDQATEAVLYDPSDPRRACLLDGLTLDVRVSPTGEWEDRGLRPRLEAGFAASSYGLGGLVIARTVWLLLR